MKVKEGLEEQYAKYVEVNSQDEYSKACITAGEAFGQALDEGKTCEEAEAAMLAAEDGLTGYMVGAVISAMNKFNPRGDEVREWWNNRFNVSHPTGTVNPAIITVKGPEDV